MLKVLWFLELRFSTSFLRLYDKKPNFQNGFSAINLLSLVIELLEDFIDFEALKAKIKSYS